MLILLLVSNSIAVKATDTNETKPFRLDVPTENILTLKQTNRLPFFCLFVLNYKMNYSIFNHSHTV